MPHLFILTKNTRGPLSPRRKEVQNKDLQVGGQPVLRQREKGLSDFLPRDHFASPLSYTICMASLSSYMSACDVWAEG